MSIDYSDMAFPKPVKRKKKRSENESQINLSTRKVFYRKREAGSVYCVCC